MGADVLGEGAVFASDYRVLRPLSSGGMGSVYVVQQLSTGAQRALKLMHPALVSSPREVREIFEQLCHGLQAAHEIGVVHRDIKPENVFLATPRRAGASLTVKILDFGIAKVAAEARATFTAAVGTPLWMAPEQCRESSEIAPATDVWALGLLAFWMLTGRVYFRAANQPVLALDQLMQEILNEPPAPASRRALGLGRPGTLPRGFDEWFARCVDREPSRRHQNAGQAFAGLAPVLEAGELALGSTMVGAPPLAMPGTAAASPSPALLAPAPTEVAPPTAVRTAMAPAPLVRRRSPVLAVMLLLTGLAALGAVATTVLLSRSSTSAPSPTAEPIDSPQAGSVTSAQVEAFVRRNTPALRRSCWDPALARDRKGATTVHLHAQFRVRPDGTMDGVHVTGSEGGHPGLRTCLERQLKSWVFPRASRGAAFSIPISFAVLDNPYRPNTNCDPPYTVDANGVKRPKPGCL